MDLVLDGTSRAWWQVEERATQEAPKDARQPHQIYLNPV